MSGHRASVARTRIAERVTITNGAVTRTTNLIRCTWHGCDEVVTLRHGSTRDVWVHGMPEGVIEEAAR